MHWKITIYFDWNGNIEAMISQGQMPCHTSPHYPLPLSKFCQNLYGPIWKLVFVSISGHIQTLREVLMMPSRCWELKQKLVDGK
jgi:hypothetical protein